MYQKFTIFLRDFFMFVKAKKILNSFILDPTTSIDYTPVQDTSSVPVQSQKSKPKKRKAESFAWTPERNENEMII